MPWISAFHLLTERLFLRKRGHRGIVRCAQLGLIAASGIAAFLLRLEFVIPEQMLFTLRICLAVWLAAKTVVFGGFGLDRGMWRYFSTPDALRVALANVAASALAAALLQVAPVELPHSIVVLDFLLTLMGMLAIRASARLLLDLAAANPALQQKRTFIYGAGRAGALLLRESRAASAFPHRISGFIDDDPSKQGLLVNGVPVLGGGADLQALAQKYRVRDVIIAIPTAERAAMAAIVATCQRANLVTRTIPAISELIGGKCVTAQLRDVAVEDVLGRTAVTLDHAGIAERLRGKVALITGAAGSIGSELCRQIARFQPAAIVGYDIAESALFEVDQELQRSFPGVLFYPEIGSIQNLQRLREVFAKYKPAVVYHAAAYKHVPLMEAHVFEAIENNVSGTFNVAVTARDFGVPDFVMISSDKAVRPTNVMGASKRIAELVIRSLQGEGTRFVSVRFGNVLGSNGSVVPIFKRQIAAGGPVTVTHPEMRRYFMTMPEAAQLVLQASTMGKGGEIFVLDMGQPVRIADLARQLIALSGLRPDEDIQIVYTGIRPGEKLFEELNIDSEAVLPTFHEKIRIFAGGALPAGEALRRLAMLRECCQRRDLAGLLHQLREFVPDYQSSLALEQQAMAGHLSKLAAALIDDQQPNPAPANFRVA